MKFMLVTTLLACVKLTSAGNCMRCSDDFATFQLRRGRGATTGNQGWTAPLTGSPAMTQFTDPSPHWRNEYDGSIDPGTLMRIVYQGPPNWWIDNTQDVLKMWLAPGAATSGVVTRVATDLAGPLWPRSGATYVTGAFQAANNVLNGEYGGAYYAAEGFGLSQDAEELAADFALYDPTGVGGVVGLFFNMRSTNVARSYYGVLARNQTGGAGEVGISVIKVDATGAVTLLGKTNSVSIAVNRADGANMQLNGPRVWSRIHASKQGGNIRVWLNNDPSTVVLNVNDGTGNLLPAGMPGILAFGVHAMVVDNVLFVDTPSCSNGFMDGDETGVDCGGTCGTACPTGTQSYLWNANTNGHRGMIHTQYGDNPNGQIFGVPVTYPDGQDFMVQPSNANGALPGSTGTNAASWQGSWHYVNAEWPPARDLDFYVELQPGDNDYVGIVWRYIDRDNYYLVNARTEAGSGVPQLTIQRRRNGRNVVLWNAPATIVAQTGATTGNPSWTCQGDTSAYPRIPFHSCVRQRWRVRMVGARIELYWPPLDPGTTGYQTLLAGALTPTLLTAITDPEPLMMAGQVGVAVTTHDHLKVWEIGLTAFPFTRLESPSMMALPLAPATRGTLTFGFDGNSILPSAVSPSTEVVADYSPRRGLLHSSVFMVPSNAVPVYGEGQCGAVLPFNGAAGAQYLYSHQISTDADPGITGFTLTAVFRANSVPAASGRAVIAAKGGRSPYQAGWRLYVTTASNLCFEALTNNVLDRQALICAPYTMGTIAVVTVVVRPDPATASVTRLESRRFLVEGQLNNGTFMDATNNAYLGIVATGESADLFVGALEDGSSQLAGEVRELQTFATPMNAGDLGRLTEYLSTKHKAGRGPTCPSLASPAFGFNNVTVFSTLLRCTTPANGDVCQLACAAGAVQVAGDTSMTCSNGEWLGNPIICQPGCAVPTNTGALGRDARPCSYDLLVEDWAELKPLGVSGCASTVSMWNTFPAGLSAFQVTTAGRLTVDPSTTSPGLTSRIISSNAYVQTEPSLTMPGARTVYTGLVPFPDPSASDTFPVALLEFYPRWMSDRNHYAVRTAFTYTDGLRAATPLVNSTTFVRVFNGVAATLCTAGAAAIPYLSNDPTPHVVSFFTNGQLTVTTNGVTWCNLPQELTIPFGETGYGVRATRAVTFGPIRVTQSFPFCPDGTLRSVVPFKAVVTQQCNNEFEPSGSEARMCNADGTFLGTPLSCQALPPVVANATVTVAELSPVDTVVAQLTASRVPRGSTVEYVILSGNTNGAFTIGGCDGLLRVANPTALDFEQLTGSSSFFLLVRARILNSNPVSETIASVSVTVTNINDPPVLQTTVCNVDENAALGSTACLLNIVDLDTQSATFVVTLETQEVPGAFTLSGSSLLVSTPGLNHEGKSTYTATIRVADASDLTSFSLNTVTIRVRDLPEAPTITGPAIIQVPSSALTTGNPLGVFIAATDQDGVMGTRITSYGITTLGSNPALLSVEPTTGQLLSAVNTASSYTLAGLFEKDGFIVADYTEVTLRATDDTLPVNGGNRTGTLMAKVYIMGDVATNAPVVRRVQVNAADPASGAGTTGLGVHTLSTDGLDSVTFTIDNLVVTANSGVECLSNTSDTSVRTYTVQCTYEGLTTVGANNVATAVRCPTSAGWGVGWTWALTTVDGASRSPIVPATSMSFTYALPVINSVGVEVPNTPVATTGGTAMVINGYNFGGPASGAPVTVRYGPADPVTGVVNWRYQLTVLASGVGHTTIRGVTVAGDGGNLRVQVSVGGRVVSTGPSVVLSYATPTITNITLSSGLPPNALNGAGGDELIITGTNFGMGFTGTPILRYGPIVPGVPATIDTLPMATVTAGGVSTCTYVALHTQVRCTVQSGVGRNLVAALSVGNGVGSTLATQRLTFALPSITGISGPGSRDMDTKGGQAFTLTGLNFGPAAVQSAGGVYPAPVVTYGPASAPSRYTAVDCAIQGVGATSVVCLTAEGSGGGAPNRGFVFRITAGNQTSTSWQAPASCEYGSPKVNSVTKGYSMAAAGTVAAPFLSGTNAAMTQGGEIVNIRGKNFGPFNLSGVDANGLGYNVFYYTDVDLAGTGNLTVVKYTPLGCSRFTPTGDTLYLPLRQYHEQIYCMIAPGAGESLKWEVVVSGKVSTEPTVAYSPPVISAVSTSPTANIRVGSASDLGGSTVYLRGDFMGPITSAALLASGLRLRNFVQSVKYGPYGGEGAVAYTPLSWSFTADHTTLEVELAPGIGQNLVFQVIVGDQTSDIVVGSAQVSFDFSRPQATRIEPSTVAVAGGTIVRVYGTGFGLLDPTTAQSVTVGGVPVVVVDRYPALIDVQRAATGNGTLTAEQLDPANHYIAFSAPPGIGFSLPVTVTAFRVLDTSVSVSSDPAADGAATWMHYTEPILDYVSIERITDSAVLQQAQTFFPSAPAASLRLMTLIGGGFGSSNSGRLTVQIDADNTFAAPQEAQIIGYSDSRITAFVDSTSGFARIAILAPLPTDPQGFVRLWTSEGREFTDASPSIQAIEGTPVDGYPTVGGTLALIKARNLNTFTNLVVFVGNASSLFCTLDGVTILTIPSVLTTIIQPQVAEQAARNIAPQDMVFTIGIRVPAGQGSAVPVVVVRDGVAGSGVSTIRYAAPVINAVRLSTTATTAATPASAITVANPFQVPTAGAELFVNGVHFGTCPIYFWGLYRGAACAQDRQPTDQLVFVARSHTQIRFRVPEGAGSGAGAWRLIMTVGDQLTASLPVTYARPIVTAVVPTGPWGMPTEGGVVVNVQGSNFGSVNSSTPVVDIVLDSNTVVPCTQVMRMPGAPHNNLTCVLPEGSGALLNVTVAVADHTQTSARVLSYDAPRIASVVNINSTNLTATGETSGGYDVVVTGSNFGPSGAGHCLFLPSAVTPVRQLVCNGAADSWDEFEIAHALIHSWSHTSIHFTMVAGMGSRVVTVVARGGVSMAHVNGSNVFNYSSPVIESVEPATACTDGDRCPGGATVVTIRGRNFGYGSTISANSARTLTGYTAQAPVMPTPGQSGAYPSPFAMRINFFSAARCISSAVVDDSTANTRPTAVGGCFGDNAPLADRRGYGVIEHTHDTIRFLALPGVGKDRTLSVVIVSDVGDDIESNAWSFSYSPPELTAATPAVWRMAAPLPVVGDSGLLGYRMEGQLVVLMGQNFGPPVDSTWSLAERAVAVSIDGLDQVGPLISETEAYPVRRFENNRARVEFIYPSMGNTGFLPLLSMPTVGFKNVSALIAGQRNNGHAVELFRAACRVGYYGLPGEVCDECPMGAVCDGYRAELAQAERASTAESIRRYGPLRYEWVVSAGGINASECMTCHTSPRAKAGFFNMKGLLNKAGVSESICSPLRAAEGRRTPEQCDYIVACDPPEACLTDNVCADGYANKEWPFRCGQCADGFFRSAGTCRRCPDNPALNIVFFFLAAVVAIGIGWFLNQKQINIAFLTIGLDYLQVISIFANTRVAWPPQIKELFRILSAFNLNIEIVAPECAFKGISYGQKWGMIMLLPIAVNVLLLLIHGVNVVVLLIKGQSKKRIAGMASPLIAMAQVLMYFLYLYITRSVFDVMTCRSLDPPEYTKTGQLKLYMAGVMEECGIPGGTQEQLLPGAVAALIVYVLGYPAAVGFNLWKNRELVMEDQLLRAKRTGDDRLTNPNALEFRRRFARTYYQFKPDRFLWVLAIILRKFLIAISSLVFNTNQNFQMAAMLLVLFLAYAAQVRYLPYMGPANFDQVLKDHEDAAKAGDPVQAKLAGIIAQVQTKGRKRTYNSNFNAVRKVSVNALAKAVARFFFDYNTVEALLLASALLVSLAGVMFGATEATPNSSFYQQSRDGVMSAVIILVAVSILYWLTVVFVEAWSIVDEQAQQSRATARGRGKGTGKGLDDEEDSNRAAEGRSERAAAALGPVETLTNPMFTSKDGKGKSGAATTGISPDALMAMDMPQGAAWMAVRDAYVEQAEKAAAVAAEVARLKAEVAKARMYAAAVGDPESSGAQGGGDVPPSPRTPGTQKRRAFGPEQAGGVVSPLAAVRGKNVSGLRLKQ